MYSTCVKFIIALTGLAPIFLSSWLVKVIQNIDKWTFCRYADIWQGMEEILANHYLLFTFIFLILLGKYFFGKAIKNLTVCSITVKSIKPVDMNFSTVLFSYMLPWFKFFMTSITDWAYLAGNIMIYFILVYLWQNSYHYNLVIRMLFGYRNYEIKTKDEVTYLMLTKTKLVNPRQVKEYVELADYMIVDVTK